MLLSFGAINVFGGILWQRSGKSLWQRNGKSKISPEWISQGLDRLAQQVEGALVSHRTTLEKQLAGAWRFYRIARWNNCPQRARKRIERGKKCAEISKSRWRDLGRSRRNAEVVEGSDQGWKKARNLPNREVGREGEEAQIQGLAPGSVWNVDVKGMLLAAKQQHPNGFRDLILVDGCRWGFSPIGSFG